MVAVLCWAAFHGITGRLSLTAGLWMSLCGGPDGSQVSLGLGSAAGVACLLTVREKLTVFFFP